MAIAAPVKRYPACSTCSAPVFYPRECDGRPRKLDASPVGDGQWVVVTWNALLHGVFTTFVAPFDASEDQSELRYQDHHCPEER